MVTSQAAPRRDGNRTKRRGRWGRALGWSLPVALALALWTTLGRAHPDEPFYLYCGKLAWEGQRPYQDFFFTQMPLAAYLYGAAVELLGPHVWAGRLVSAVLTWLDVVLVLRLTDRTFGGRATRLAVLLMATGSYPLWHLTIAKGYAWGALTLALALSIVARPRRRAAAAGVAAGALLAAGALARTTTIVAAPVIAAWDVLAGRRWARAVALGCGSAVVLALGALPFVRPDWRAFRFGVWDFHAVSWMVDQHPWSNLVEWYWPQLTVLAVAIAVAAMGGGMRGVRLVLAAGSFPLVLALVVGALTLAHLSAGAKAPEYHALTFPLTCALLAGWLARAWRLTRRLPRGRVALRGLIVAGVVAAAGPGLLITQPGLIIAGGVDPEPEAALVAAIAQNVPPGGTLLTLHPELLLAADRHGVAGTEMGVFSVMYAIDLTQWRPPGAFTEQDFLHRIQRRDVDAVALRAEDVGKLDFAARQRSGQTDFARQLTGALNAFYELKVTTPPFDGRRWHDSYQLWVRSRG